ncbi:Outer envelope membrane protein 7 [Tripterygium wilfordii]|uniref:Outer envelope membrane protein 7 n=1 Tax=Tripterygium wilfordii TaxID=458696 RepID=A0A7J7CBP1_TRIWF|nr:Outer envelope membrane protein 7 [Tripterygium wilfordii]
MGSSTATKQAMVVFGALAFGWLAIEMTFKPFLDKARAAMAKSDPEHDPDDEEETNHSDIVNDQASSDAIDVASSEGKSDK